MPTEKRALRRDGGQQQPLQQAPGDDLPDLRVRQPLLREECW